MSVATAGCSRGRCLLDPKPRPCRGVLVSENVAHRAALYWVTALVPSDTACLASSPGRTRRVAVCIPCACAPVRTCAHVCACVCTHARERVRRCVRLRVRARARETESARGHAKHTHRRARQRGIGWAAAARVIPPQGNLYLTGGERALLVVLDQLAPLFRDPLENVSDERVHRAHAPFRHAAVRVHLLEHLHARLTGSVRGSSRAAARARRARGGSMSTCLVDVQRPVARHKVTVLRRAALGRTSRKLGPTGRARFASGRALRVARPAHFAPPHTDHPALLSLDELDYGHGRDARGGASPGAGSTRSLQVLPPGPPGSRELSHK